MDIPGMIHQMWPGGFNGGDALKEWWSTDGKRQMDDGQSSILEAQVSQKA